MPEKDIAEKILEDHPDVFADISNMYLFNGEQRIKPKDLEDSPVRSMYKMDGHLHAQERDVYKLWKPGGVMISMLGLENQTTVDWDMPLRVVGYDGSVYQRQIALGALRYPVLTIVLYFGDEPWTAPLNLLGRIPVQDEALLPLLNDWRINLWQVAYSQPWQVRGLNSDFKFIADCCVQRRLKQEYRPISADKLVYPYETLELMSLVTNDQRFRQVRSSIGMKEDVTMYMILDKMMNESEAKGRLAGFTDGKLAGFADGKLAGISEGRLAGFADGKLVGISEGRLAGIIATARRMKMSGMSNEQIASFTDLSLKEIDAL